jgi:acylphosphatase
LPQLHAIIHGHVQGVSFRYYTLQQAQSLELTGWVKNLPNRTVEVLAVGPRGELEQLLDWLGHGPTGARVSQVEADWQDSATPHDTFEIRHF